MNNFNIRDFIKITQSDKPAIIISECNNRLLVSIDEYNGDYLWVNINNAIIMNLNCEEELSILANFGGWFYEQHKLLYQEKILNCIYNFLT